MRDINLDLLLRLEGGYTASVFSLPLNEATRFRDWLNKQAQLTGCSKKGDTLEWSEILRDITLRTKWSKKRTREGDVVKFKLPETHIEFLKSHLQNSETYLLKLLQHAIVASYFNVDDKLTIELHDWAGEQLQIVGFDKYYNTTSIGQILEDLLDLLS